MTSRQAEQNANIALGTLLTRMLPTCTVKIENTRVIASNPGLRPDILITGRTALPSSSKPSSCPPPQPS